MSQRLCLIEDDEIMGESLRDRFEIEGYRVDWHRSADAAVPQLRAGDYALAISDIRLPGRSGEELFMQLRDAGMSLPAFIFITGQGSIDAAVRLLRAGATDYVTKPFDLDELVGKVTALAPVHAGPAMDSVLGISAAMHKVQEQLARVAGSGACILLVGESGVGKEYAARFLHQVSARNGPLVGANCGAMNESLLESELFGHERGAFTGAQRTHHGLLEQAQGGTLLLDEIGDMPTTMQVKLLRALQERQITRVGGERPIAVDFNLISATHRDLRQMVLEGAFREDLYYRVNTVQVRIPPLRERPEDILWFAGQFLRELSQPPQPPKRLSIQAEQALLSYAWPGNLRELHHALERACLLAGGPELQAGDIFADSEYAIGCSEPTEHASLGSYLADCERSYIRRMLAHHDGRVAKTAEGLGISRKALWDKMRRLGITRQAEADPADII